MDKDIGVTGPMGPEGSPDAGNALLMGIPPENDTSGPDGNEELPDDRPRCCRGHFEATNRAQRRAADRTCKVQKAR